LYRRLAARSVEGCVDGRISGDKQREWTEQAAAAV